MDGLELDDDDYHHCLESLMRITSQTMICIIVIARGRTMVPTVFSASCRREEDGHFSEVWTRERIHDYARSF